MKNSLPADCLHKLFNYNPTTGELTWNVHRGRMMAGDRAGCIFPDKYVRIKLGNKAYPVGRLIWMWLYSKEPDGEIDHINGNRSDNRLANLRDVSKSINIQNQRKASKNNKTGLLGVTPHGRRWRARIWVDGKNMHIGHFPTKEQAYNAYVGAKRQLHEGCTL